MCITECHEGVEGYPERDYQRMDIKVDTVSENDKYAKIDYKGHDPVRSSRLFHQGPGSHNGNCDKHYINRSYPCIEYDTANEQYLPLMFGTYPVIGNEEYDDENKKRKLNKAHFCIPS